MAIYAIVCLTGSLVFSLTPETASAVQAQTPKLFLNRSFNCDDLADAVNHYVSIGQDASLKELSSIGARTHHIFGVDENERVGWVCRILFLPKNNHSLRAPWFGGLIQIPPGFDDHSQWPLYPIAHSGSSYFVLSEGYELAGYPEQLASFLKYCRTNGSFRTVAIPCPTRKQALEDFASLQQSKQWKAIKWSGSQPGETWAIPEAMVVPFIKQQASSIPAAK